MRNYQSMMLPVLFLFAAGPANSECDPQVIRSFFNELKLKESGTRAEALYNKTCSSRSSNNGISVSLPVEVPFSGKASSKTIRTACATSDKKFFETYAKELILVHLDDDVKLRMAQQCFNGVTMIATENSGSITIELYGKTDRPEGVKVESFEAHPCKSVIAESKVPGNGTWLPPNGTAVTYIRKNRNVDITFQLLTKDGAGIAKVVLPGRQVIPVTWHDAPIPMKKGKNLESRIELIC